MQRSVPKGRSNYEPDRLADQGEDGGPRECPMTGFATTTAPIGEDEDGAKLRVRGDLCADHYSQARMCWLCLSGNERAHVAWSVTFDLSKVGQLDQGPPHIVGNTRNVDEELAKGVAAGFGLDLPPK
jgi:catalase